MGEKIGRQKYLDELEVGSLVAFRLYENDAKNFSGKVLRIDDRKSICEIETKNGKKFFVEKKNITWVNTNGRWPKHIIIALRGLDVEKVEVNEDGEEQGKESK